MNGLTIGKVAKLAGVGVETVRYYERRGLISKPQRSEPGYRKYPEEAVLRIRFVKRAKRLGFTLKEIKELLALRINPRAKCGDILKRAESKLEEIDEKIRALAAIKEALLELTAACKAGKTSNECPILESLDMDDKASDITI